MSWPSSSAQLTAHGSSHIYNSFDDWHLIGTVFLNNRTRRNRKFFLHINKTVEFYSHDIKESRVSGNVIRQVQVLTFASDMYWISSPLFHPTLPATGDGEPRIRWLCLSLQGTWPSPWHQFCRSGMATETVTQQFCTFLFSDSLCLPICNSLDFLRLIFVYFL